MKVAMVMPMSPESAIADVMSQALPGLSAHWDVDVWCPAEARYRLCPVPVIPFISPTTEVLSALAEYDLVVYVLGDSPRHSRILPLALALPGLAVLHDASLTNLVRRTAIETGTMDALVLHVAAGSGADLAEILRHPDRAGGSDAWLRFCDEVPLDEIATEGSLGAVVHSRWHARRVDGHVMGDVTVAPLPVPSAQLGFDEDESDEPTRLLAELPDDAVLVVTVGAVNANRQIDTLLRAIADDDVLSRRVHLWAVGPSEGQTSTDLLRLAEKLGLADRFAVTGRVSDTSLHAILSRADISAALRDPVLEGQSASVLTQLASGKPVVVYDHAHYAELPDDVAVKVDPDDGRAGVRSALRLLVDDEDARTRRGERAREYVLRSRSGSAYAAALVEAGELAMAAKPFSYLSTDLRARLVRLDLHREAAVRDAVTDLAFDLFDLA
jgi:glycosyltransferase involved in cell wall biosynthesis